MRRNRLRAVRRRIGVATSLASHAVAPAIDVGRLAQLPRAWRRYASELQEYRRLSGDEEVDLMEARPALFDRVKTTPVDPHYFYQDVWAANRVAESRPLRHVDVGSRVDYVGFLTAITEVTFVDIRPVEVELDRFDPIAGSVVDLPFADRSIESLSCLHVAEHIGLGRYGDALDPAGTRKAAAELQRVLARGGRLLFSLPVGRPRVCFNSHRIHSPLAVREMFEELELTEFSCVDDLGQFSRYRALSDLKAAGYACGLFAFERLS